MNRVVGVVPCVVVVVGRGRVDGVVLEAVARAGAGVVGPVGRARRDRVAAVQIEVRVREAVRPGARAVVARGADRVRAGGEAGAVPGLAGRDLGDRQLDRAGAGDPGRGVGGGAGDRGAGRPAGGVGVADGGGGEAGAVPGLAGRDLGDRQLDRAGAGDPGRGVGGGAGDRGAGRPAGGV